MKELKRVLRDAKLRLRAQNDKDRARWSKAMTKVRRRARQRGSSVGSRSLASSHRRMAGG